MELRLENLKPGDLFVHIHIELGFTYVVKLKEINHLIIGTHFYGYNGGSSGTEYINGIEGYEYRLPHPKEIKRFQKQHPGIEFTIPNVDPIYEVY